MNIDRNGRENSHTMNIDRNGGENSHTMNMTGMEEKIAIL